MKSAILASAVSLLLAPAALAATVIESGTGFGTYYYDIKNPDACYNNFRSMNSGYVECSNAPLSLNTINSNNLVAMSNLKIAADPKKYCGKQVVVSVNGVPSKIPFFIGDGCERCGAGTPGQTKWNPLGAPGLDFSYSQLAALNPNACFAGHIDISWQILDTTIYNFKTNSLMSDLVANVTEIAEPATTGETVAKRFIA